MCSTGLISSPLDISPSDTLRSRPSLRGSGAHPRQQPPEPPSRSISGCLSGYDLFKLQDTYGFPLELSVEECYREGIELTKDYLKEFYESLGFQTVSEMYLEDDIPHVEMLYGGYKNEI